ncbi:diguanylate cyclase/phosphodiesterase with PAS/PAC sensor(s) [Acidovorax sp. 62]|uniref:EAL domain-containing protein n=1 Tax=Acidovorax sp. 62 TaxID=2035203 RepID=UPI000C1741C2|nr:EAL domain-containing protein [Acidovorax sp. 62]PIF92651.1 diguanylate cyclase/phosphodiesterase with PAS/PAC sensor(s) [Acidovorax sp. 62]
MAGPVLSPAEFTRLQALQACAILDTPQEASFDQLATLATRLCDAPMAVVNFLDAERQWFKASVGVPMRETPRSIAFCDHALRTPEVPTVVEDATQHPLFATNPLVVGEPHIRFYACIPLVTAEGQAIGTLAVMDTRSRSLSAEALQALQMLARQAMDQLELRRQKHLLGQMLQERDQMHATLRLQSQALEAAGRVARLGGWIVELPSQQLTLSPEMAAAFGFAQSAPTLAQVLAAYTPPHRERMQAAWQACMQAGTPINAVAEMVSPQGQLMWVRTAGQAVRNAQGEIQRIQGAFQDVSAQHQAEMQTQRNARHHADLLQVQQQISSLDMALPEALKLVAHTVQQQTGARGALIELLEDEQLVAKASVGDMVRPEGNQLSVHDSILWPALHQGRTVWCNDTLAAGWDMDSMPHRFGVRSVMAAPLRAGNSIVGSLKVTSDQPEAFSRGDVDRLEILTESLGTTVQLRHVASQLQASAQQYRLMFNEHPHPMWVYERASMRLLAVNEAMLSQYGYTEAEMLQMHLLDLWPPTEREAVRAAVQSISPERRHVPSVCRQVRKDGSLFDAEITAGSISFNGLAARQVLAVDITERLQAEREIARMARAQKLLSACNETLVRATSESALLQAICQIAVDIGGYRMGWVGLAQDDAHKTIAQVAHAGHSQGYLDKLHLSWDANSPNGQGPAGRAVRTGEPVIVHDIRNSDDFGDWTQRMLDNGFHGIICLPLRERGRAFGLLYLYAPDILHISAQEVALLQELANDLAFGINSLRAHQAQQRMLDSVIKVAAAVSATTGTEFFVQLARSMAEALGAQVGCLIRLVPQGDGELPRAVDMATVVDGKQVLPSFNLPLDGTPSMHLLTQRQYVVADQVLQQYPRSPLGSKINARAYAGQQLCSADGEVIGAIFVLFRQPLADPHFVTSTLQIFAARASAEIERQTADARIRHQASLLDKAQDAILVRDLDHRIIYWNKSAERMYGWSQLQVLGQSVQTLLYDDPTPFYRATEATIEHGEWTGELVQQHRDGRTIDVEGRWTLVRGEDGRPQSILAINTDITQRKATEREIQRLAFYDPLTNLPNRMLLMDRMHQALVAARRHQQGGALLFIDLDNFKQLNDTLGHDQGDLLLQQVAKRLSLCVRSVDTVARLGGDEFVVMLEELNPAGDDLVLQARGVGEKILAMLSMPYPLQGYQYRSTPSIGIAPFTGVASTTVGELLKQADLAMYQAKTAGRNTLRFFDPQMQAVVTARAALEADLRVALAQDEFLLHYQPQVRQTGEIAGVEALLRWKHAQRGMVPPSDFIALAEETGLILPLGRWVLHHACKLLASWQDDPLRRDLTMAVNVSSSQFRNASFVDDVARVLAITGAPSGQLKLELTESLLVEDMETTIATMAALRAYGVGFSLDDFGTGYSSLSYLKRMPLDQLKIDQSFVRDLLTDPNDAAIVDTIIGLSRSLGLEVIAEGVETAEQRALLARAGCELYQGYLFSKALPEPELDAFLSASPQSHPQG